MRIVIRADGGQQIGGGHIMRCLTLAAEAKRRSHEVRFIVGEGPMAARVRDAGFAVCELPAQPHKAVTHPPHAGWLSAAWEEDAVFSSAVVADMRPDWLIWDHYGLDSRWVAAVRAVWPDVRVLALDDLDDRELGADVVLDPARMGSDVRVHPVPSALDGPQYALLRPEFAALRPAALARRVGPVRRVLIAPGMMDAAGLAPTALRALENTGWQAEVVMGAASQSVDEVRALIAGNPDWTLTLDAQDMAQRMVDADLCIGAGGGTAWERCCMGLPSVVVAVADNQREVIERLAQAGGVVPARMRGLAAAIGQAREGLSTLSSEAAKLCDGQGAARVMDALEGRLRPVTQTDTRRIFDWRNQPHIRATSHIQVPLDLENHTAWVTKTLARRDVFWRIYEECGRGLGAVLISDQGGGVWQWSFYIGADNAPRGAGGRMLSYALAELAAQTDAQSVEGEVLVGNLASARLHERLGFVAVQSDKAGVLVFRKQICDQTASTNGA